MKSLRHVARELGVSHTLLVLWKQGKRSLNPELERRYHQLVSENGYTESGYKSGYTEGVGSSWISDDSGESSQSASDLPAAWAGSSAWLEHRTFNPSVQGSNPCRPTTSTAHNEGV